MSDWFFDSLPASDPIYQALRAPGHANAIEGRRYFDELWLLAAPFVGDDLRQSARSQFQQVFWEVYLAAGLQRQGVALVTRAERGAQSPGPDFLQREPPVFYEAVAVTPGTQNPVPEPVVGVAGPVPDDAISLRLTSGLQEKVRRYERYSLSLAVPADVPCVIAINAGGIPGAYLEQSIPRIVRAVLPFGPEVLHLDPASGRRVGHSYGYRAELTKPSGAKVPSNFFDQPATRGISAILYSCVDPFNAPEIPGADFLVIHNPRATNPLARNDVPASYEFWVEDGRLRGEKTHKAG